MQPLEQKVVALLSEFADSLPRGAARLDVNDSGTEYGGTVVHLEPAKPGAAKVWVHVTGAEQALNVGAGRCTMFEFRDDATSQAIDTFLVPMCRAVVEGGLEETLVTKDGRIVLGTGRLTLPDGERTSRMLSPWANPFARKRVETIRYEAY